MLPAPSPLPRSLAEVSGQHAASLWDTVDRGEQSRHVLTYVVVDGLGADLIAEHSGHCRTLHRALVDHGDVVSSGLPSTTAAALASITTGVSAGTHGLLGYQLRDPQSHQLVNHLKPFPSGVTPTTWQPVATHFETATQRGIGTLVVGEGRFEGTDFSESILRGGDFVSSYSLDEHLEAYRSFADSYDYGLGYLYWPTLDRIGHGKGVDSVAWRDALEQFEQFFSTLQSLIGPGEQVVLLADHGMVDVPANAHWVMDASHPLRSAVAMWAGEPRCVHLYLHDPREAELIASELSALLEGVATVLGRQDCLDRGLFGPVSPAVFQRVGDLVLFAQGHSALYDELTATIQSRQMIGQHGSWTPREMRVPAIVLAGG